MWGVRVRIPRSLATSGFRPEGWEGVADEAPEWSATVAARWTVPWIDWDRAGAGAFIGGAAMLGLLGGWGHGSVWAVALMGVVSLWALLPAGRALAQLGTRATATITLEPERLTLETGSAGATRVVLDRARAGWLVADEITSDWRARQIALYDDDGRLVTSVVGAMTRVESRASGTPRGRDLPGELPLAVLVGAWWPHPARRMTRQGTAGIALRWRDPGIASYERYERRSRILWSLLWLALAALLVWAALDPPTRDALRIPLVIAGGVIVAWRIRVLLWRPTMVSRR